MGLKLPLDPVFLATCFPQPTKEFGRHWLPRCSVLRPTTPHGDRRLNHIYGAEAAEAESIGFSLRLLGGKQCHDLAPRAWIGEYLSMEMLQIQKPEANICQHVTYQDLRSCDSLQEHPTFCWIWQLESSDQHQCHRLLSRRVLWLGAFFGMLITSLFQRLKLGVH